MKNRLLSLQTYISRAYTCIQTTRGKPIPAVKARLNLILSLMTVALCVSAEATAQTRSDILIVLDADGIGYTAQQTIFAEDVLVVSRLPLKRKTIETFFSGAGSALYRRAHENEPDKITLVTGAAFTRFRHRFQSREGTFDSETDSEKVLQASLDDYQIATDDFNTLTYSVSWLLPSNLDLVSFIPAIPDTPDPPYSWTQNGPMLTFTQTSGAPPVLKIEYRVKQAEANPAEDCIASIGPSEWCSPDIDEDTVPDYRDLCLAAESDDVTESDPAYNVLADQSVGNSSVARATPSTPRSESLGCDDDTQLVLADVQFESDRTYLNVKARTVLDKVAIAIQRNPDRLYRIGAYTDDAGNFQTNQRLSKDRADAIRHYLMLRGVSPNQLQAQGYGEADPLGDNTTAEGRRVNQRVELQQLN